MGLGQLTGVMSSKVLRIFWGCNFFTLVQVVDEYHIGIDRYISDENKGNRDIFWDLVALDRCSLSG